MEVVEIGIPSVDLWNVEWKDESESESEPSHPHDDVANWLWPDNGCILWDNGGVIKL